MAQSFTKYAKDLGINVDNMIQAFEVSGKSETVVNFLEELYKIRNKSLYYLSFNLHSYNIHNYLLEFQEEELAKYTTIIDNFNRVSFKGSVIQGKNMKDCSHVEIIIRRVIDGPPKNKYKQYETSSSYDIERLKSIPTSPKSFSKKNIQMFWMR